MLFFQGNDGRFIFAPTKLISPITTDIDQVELDEKPGRS